MHYFKGASIEMLENEKFNLTVDFRVFNTTGFTSLNPVQVTLVPFDGSEPWFWEHDAGSNVNQWVERATPTTNPWSITVRWQGTNSENWNNIGGESPPLPKSGTIYIKLGANFNVFAPFHFANLSFEYIPQINGSYQSYNGSFHKIKRSATGYLASVDENVFISDTPGRLIKGTMFFLRDSFYERTVKWFDASKTALAYPTDLTSIRPFGELQAYAVWNQYRLSNTVFEYSIQGLGDDIPSLLHKYLVNDVSTLSSNRKYLMLTKDMDLKRCNGAGVIEQVYNTTEGKVYTDEHEFKYIS